MEPKPPCQTQLLMPTICLLLNPSFYRTFIILMLFLKWQQNIYELVVRHYLACVSKAAVGAETTVEIDIAGELFSACGRVILEVRFLSHVMYIFRFKNLCDLTWLIYLFHKHALEKNFCAVAIFFLHFETKQVFSYCKLKFWSLYMRLRRLKINHNLLVLKKSKYLHCSPIFCCHYWRIDNIQLLLCGFLDEMKYFFFLKYMRSQ